MFKISIFKTRSYVGYAFGLLYRPFTPQKEDSSHMGLTIFLKNYMH
jgi:hypothetical protein